MTIAVQEVSKLTDRYQTTVPGNVRRHLGLDRGDRIRWSVDGEGLVRIHPIREGDPDPALGAFLDLLETDIREHPERLQTLDGGLLARAEALVGDIEVDLDAPLDPEDE